MQGETCPATLQELGLNERCQLKPSDVPHAHWSRLTARSGVVFWEKDDGGLRIDVTLFDTE